MTSIDFIKARIAELDRKLRIGSPIPPKTRVWLWDRRREWKDLLTKKEQACATAPST